LFLVDSGLTSEERSRLAGHVTLIPAPEGVPVVFLRPFGPMQHPAEIAILLDADVVVARPLTDLVEAARGGRLVAFVNNEPNHDRFFSQWSSALSLGPIRRQPYLNAGQLVVPDSLSHQLLQLLHEGIGKVDVHRTWHRNGRLSDPFYFGDQDVLNAIVAT